MNNAVVMTSGGLDSTTVCYILADRGVVVHPLFFDYGQHCSEIEWNRVNELMPSEVKQPERVNLRDLFLGSSSRLISEANLWTDKVEDDDLYVPYRTVLFFAAAAARAQTLGILDVYSGFINSNHVKEIDCSTQFLNLSLIHI